MFRAVPSWSPSTPQLNVTMSPGLSSARSCSSLPMRSFGPGEVLEDRHRPPGAARGLADPLGGLGVLLVRAVAEVQARDVHAGADQLEQDLAVPRGRPDGRNDLGPPHTAKIREPEPWEPVKHLRPGGP